MCYMYVNVCIDVPPQTRLELKLCPDDFDDSAGDDSSGSSAGLSFFLGRLYFLSRSEGPTAAWPIINICVCVIEH